MTLERMIDKAHDYAKGLLIGHKGAQVSPTFVVQFKSRGPAIMVMSWRSDREREAALSSIEMAMKLQRADVVAYSVVSEAWVAVQDHATRAGDRPPSERDDRKEMVFACASDGLDQRFKAWEIVRGPDAVVTGLVPAVIAGEFGGRMMNLLEAK
jgi:hypothetical protein